MSNTEGPFRISDKPWHEHMAGMFEIVAEPTLVGTNLTPILGYTFKRSDAERVVACLNWCHGLSMKELQDGMSLPTPTAKTLLEFMNSTMSVLADKVGEYSKLLERVQAIQPLIAEVLAKQMGTPPSDTIN